MQGFFRSRADPVDYLLAAEALLFLAIARFGLRFFHFQRVRRILSLFASIGRHLKSRGAAPPRLAWAIETAKRRSPRPGTCLADAIAAEALFRQFGYAPVLCVGAAVYGGKFAAHAWLENNEVVMVGGPETFTRQFTRFPDLDQVAL